MRPDHSHRRVLALSCSSSAGDGLIYAAGEVQQVVLLDPLTGEVKSRFEGSNKAISCLALSPDGLSAFLGGSNLSLWDLSSQEKRAKFTGHPTPAFAAVFSPDGSHIASAAESERHVAVWLAKKKKKKAQAAVASLALEDVPIQLDTCSTSDSSSAFHVAAVSKSGEVYVWQCTPSSAGGDEEGPSQSLATHLVAKVKAAGAKGDSIMAVKIQPGSQGEPCSLAALVDANRKSTVSFPPPSQI
jgi:WD40 repeat protein